MVDRSNLKAFVRTHQNRLKSKIDAMQEQRLEAQLARTYTDDIDIREGALGLSRQHFRTSVRDDEITCQHLMLNPAR